MPPASSVYSSTTQPYARFWRLLNRFTYRLTHTFIFLVGGDSDTSGNVAIHAYLYKYRIGVHLHTFP